MLSDWINTILSLLTVVAEVLALVLLILLVTGKIARVKDFFRSNGLFIGFVVSLIAMVGSLSYSDILGYEPCKFCWFQRIFMYPLVFIFGLSLFKRKDGHAADYGLLLAIPGALIAGYHYLLQRGIVTGAACDALGYSVSCSKVFVMHYGYITIPMMAFSAFVLIIVTLLAYKKSARFSS